MKYKIVIKRDFGPYGYWNHKNRRNEKTGFVVTDGVCNIMPGATWFRTVEDAMTEDVAKAAKAAGATGCTRIYSASGEGAEESESSEVDEESEGDGDGESADENDARS